MIHTQPSVWARVGHDDDDDDDDDGTYAGYVRGMNVRITILIAVSTSEGV